MPNIPGLPTAGSIPRLGQGSPGGAAGVVGLPGAPGGSSIPGLPTLPGVPNIGVRQSTLPTIPSPALLTPGVTGLDQPATDHTKRRLDAAMQILMRVKAGQLEWKKAQKLLDDLSPEERQQLSRSVLREHATNGGLPPTDELRALRALPGGVDPGASATTNVRPSGVGTNLLKDAMESVIGMPAGIALAGKAGVHDLTHGKSLLALARAASGDPSKILSDTETGRDVLTPIGKSYAHTYGPLAQGNVGEFGKRFEQHPLGPILDAASLVSGGLGVAGRIGDAAEAVRAAKTVEIPGEGIVKLGDKPIVAPKGIKVHALAEGDRMKALQEVRDAQWNDPMARNMAEGALINATKGTTFVARDAKTGKLLGIGHHDPDIGGPEDTSSYLSHIGTTGEKKGAGQAIMHAIAKDAVEKGKTHINLQSTHSAEGFYKKLGMEEMMPGKDAGYFSGDVTKEPTFKTRVGDQYTIHEHPPKLAPKLTSDTPDDTIRGMNAHELTTDGHPMVNPTPEEIAAQPYLVKHVASTSPSGHQIHYGGNEHDDLWQAMQDKGILNEDMKFTDTGEHQVAATIIHDPETGRPVAANIGKHEGISEAHAKELEKKVLADAQARFVDKGGLNEAATPQESGPISSAPRDLPKRYSVREQGRIVASNFPDKESAVKHAQSLISPYKSPLEAFVKGGGDRGRLIDKYDTARGFNHEAETQRMMGEIASVLENSKLRVNRRSFPQVAKEVWGDIKQTRAEGRMRPGQIASGNPDFLGSRPVSHGLAVGERALVEASDLVRAGAIYLRPAYLPNNWVGNAFMNMTHQGILAPVNLGKSLVMDKYIGKRYTAAIDKAMGQNAAEVVTSSRGRGYVGSLTNPLAHSMGMLADQPFRRAAWLHEARRAGYSKLPDVQKLVDRAAGGDEGALREMATIGRKAQEEIVKFGEMNDTERSIVKNLIFVYSWMRGATRYAARFPLQHPIQSNIFHHLSQDVGKPYLDKEMGGVPYYLAGAIPVGRDKHGNPIVINPFSLNPLGTAVDAGRAIAGTAKVISGDKSFNKFVDSDVASVANPLVQSYLTAREGGKSMKTQLEQTIAPVRLAHDLAHPGSGSVFPTSRTEALGHFIVGAMFPRVADAQALQRSLEREQRADPIARIPTDMKAYKQMTGEDMPADIVGAYRGDLEQVQMVKDFQHSYAGQHGQSGFRNLPPANKVDAAIKFLAQHHLATPSQIKEYQDAAKQLTTDADLNSFANELFGSTGIGQYKNEWDNLMSQARGLRETRKRG